MGSKANHAAIQRLVVQMKDELEKKLKNNCLIYYESAYYTKRKASNFFCPPFRFRKNDFSKTPTEKHQ